MKKESKNQESVKTVKNNKTKSAEPDITLLQAVERIVEEGRNSKLSTRFMNKCKAEIELVAQAYDITPMQAILFCITLECGPYNVNFYELPRFLDLSNVKSLSFGPDIKVLVQKHILRFRNRDKDSFAVREHTMKALRENKACTSATVIVKSCDELFDVMGSWFDTWEEEEPDPADALEDLTHLFKSNREVAFAQKMLDLDLRETDKLLLAFFCHQLINEEDSKIFPSQFQWVIGSRSAFKRVTSHLAQGTHPLMQRGLLEHVCEDGTANTTMFTLTTAAKNDLLAELHLETSEVKLNNVLNPDVITPKELFYPSEIKQQIDELNSFLDEKQFQEIQRRMNENGFRTGFACLFYGSPGTGKTETVYQLARTTGRSIMLVDVPQIKSKWVGDSEKNIKALFDRYRTIVGRADRAPILLFNEADAIFGVRKNGAENAVDKMENTIQNIILQEMENLNGIMIATTNLASNLDSAFERRFLYKVRFEKPDAAVRSRIWQVMIPGLTDSEASSLAKAYELSGGQIENVARKHTINRILHGDDGDRLAVLMDYCKAESLSTTDRNSRRMGFK